MNSVEIGWRVLVPGPIDLESRYTSVVLDVDRQWTLTTGLKHFCVIELFNSLR